MDPALKASVQLPEASASCTAQLRREAARITLASPYADASGTLHQDPPSFPAVKAAITQAQASALAVPKVTGLDADVAMRGLDVVPLVSDEAALRQLASQSGQPLRLKLNGRARVSGSVQKLGAASANVAAAGTSAAPMAGSGSGRGSSSSSSGGSSSSDSWVFSGDLGLESVRINQLKLFQKLAGSLTVSESGISVHGKGTRASETLDLDLALPLLAPSLLQLQPAGEAANSTSLESTSVLGGGTGQAPERSEPGVEAAMAAATAPRLLSTNTVGGSSEAGGVSEIASTAAAAQLQPQSTLHQAGGGGLQLRCGPLQVAAGINAAGSQLDFKVTSAALRLANEMCGSAGRLYSGTHLHHERRRWLPSSSTN